MWAIIDNLGFFQVCCFLVLRKNPFSRFHSLMSWVPGLQGSHALLNKDWVWYAPMLICWDIWALFLYLFDVLPHQMISLLPHLPREIFVTGEINTVKHCFDQMSCVREKVNKSIPCKKVDYPVYNTLVHHLFQPHQMISILPHLPCEIFVTGGVKTSSYKHRDTRNMNKLFFSNSFISSTYSAYFLTGRLPRGRVSRSFSF